MSWLFYRHVGNNDNFVIQFQSEFHSWEIFYCQRMHCTLSRIIYDLYTRSYANAKRVCGCVPLPLQFCQCGARMDGRTDGWRCQREMPNYCSTFCIDIDDAVCGMCACVWHWHIVVNANRSYCYCFHSEVYLFIQFHIPSVPVLLRCVSTTTTTRLFPFVRAVLLLILHCKRDYEYVNWFSFIFFSFAVACAHSSSSSSSFHLSFIFVREIKCCLFTFGIRINKYINSEREQKLRYVRSHFRRVDLQSGDEVWKVEREPHTYTLRNGEKIMEKTWAVPHWFK